MAPIDERGRDDEFVELLAEYDEALAQGGTPLPSANPTNGDLDQRLVQARECLALLEYAWPRQDKGKHGCAPAVPSELHSLSGLRELGRFQVRSELGRGGQGVVFLAFDPLLRRDVAVKVARPEVIVTDDLRRRFQREAEAAARLTHPNLVPIYDVGNVGPLTYLVTAYCPGTTLAARLREQVSLPPVTEAARLVADLADAVAYMHGQGILHRDIKPGNILLMSGEVVSGGVVNGESSQGPLTTHHSPLTSPMLTDFGLAKFTQEATQHTRTGAMLGTPAYMAPEQADSRLAAIGPHTDVYALGAVLYEVLTGRPPFQGSNDIDIVQQVLTVEPLAPRRLRPDVPRDLETICLKCLEKDPKRRYESAAQLTDDLRAFMAGEPILARPAGTWARAAKWTRRRPAVAALSGVAAAALLALLGWAIWYDVNLREHNANLQNALDRAESGERRLREENYAIQMKMADTMQGNDPSGLLGDLLNSLRPDPEQEDLRGFEWYYLWNVASRELHLRGHGASVRAITVSPDGRLCASGDDEGNLRLWDIRTGLPLGAWAAHTVHIDHMAFSGDGSRLATAAAGADKGEFIVWEVAGKKEVTRLDAGKKLGAYRVAVAPGGGLIAFAGCEGDEDHRTLGTWNPQTEQVQYLFRDRSNVLTALQFSPDGHTLLAGNLNPCVPLCWDLHSGEREYHKFHLAQGRINSLAFSPDGKFLASGAEGSLNIWELAQSQLHATREVSDQVDRVAFSPDGKILAVVTRLEKHAPESIALNLWNWPKGDRRPEVLKPGFIINDVVFSPDSRTIAMGCSDRHVHLWRPFAESAVSTLAVPGKKEAWSVAFSPDSQTLAVGYDDEAGFNKETLKLWEVRTGKELMNLNGHRSMVSEVALTPDGRLLASASYDKDVKLWDPLTRKLLATLKGATDRLKCLAVSPDGRLLAAAGYENNVHVWDIPTGRECYSLTNDISINRVAFAPDSKTLAATDFTGLLIFWDMATGRRVGTLRDSRHTRGLAYAPNGLSVATGNADGVVKLWDVAGDSEPRSLIGHTAEVYTVAFSPDGKTLASGGTDRTIRLWQVATGRELLVFKDLPHQVNSVAFSPDGCHLAAAIHDGSVRVWHAASPDP
jgi:WD40 repeat protein/tRNA A-37 threonylcarbamoyl transferase component Bud32